MFNILRRKFFYKIPLVHAKCSASTNRSKELNSSVHIFDRNAKYLQRERAAMMPDNHIYDYVKDEIGYILADKLNDISRPFKIGIDLGCGKGYLAKNICMTSLEHLHMTEFSDSLLSSAAIPENIKVTKTVVDEEKPLPFDSKSIDVVLSNLSLHWVNNLPGCFKEVYRILKPDGAFLCSMFSGDTLFQLRSSFLLAELEREGGFSPHVSPFTENKDVGGLLNQAGFTMLTIDTDEMTISYPSLFELMGDLKGMGENNATFNRKLHLHRDTMLAAAAIYEEMYGNEDGSIPATFQITHMIGWKPDPTNLAKVAKRGSGKISMKDIDKLDQLIKEQKIDSENNDKGDH